MTHLPKLVRAKAFILHAIDRHGHTEAAGSLYRARDWINQAIQRCRFHAGDGMMAAIENANTHVANARAILGLDLAADGL